MPESTLICLDFSKQARNISWEGPFNHDFMQVKSKAKLVDGLDDHLGSYAIAVPSIRQGYRYSFDAFKGTLSRDF
jgi:hypothetical protein